MYHLNVFNHYKKINVKVGDKSQKRHFYKNITEIQSDYLWFFNYIRQMYHVNVLC